MFLHIHDYNRRRREESSGAEIPRCIFASTKSELHALACSANSQLQGRSIAIPDCELAVEFLMVYQLF